MRHVHSSFVYCLTIIRLFKLLCISYSKFVYVYINLYLIRTYRPQTIIFSFVQILLTFFLFLFITFKIIKINAAKYHFIFWCARVTMNEESTTRGLKLAPQHIWVWCVTCKRVKTTHASGTKILVVSWRVDRSMYGCLS